MFARPCVLLVCLVLSSLGCGLNRRFDPRVDPRLAVVSDIDDTVKATNVPSCFDKLYRGVCGTDTFPGMAELFQGLLDHPQPGEAPRLFFVSGSPEALHRGLEKLLSPAHGFPASEMALNGEWPLQCTADFKADVLRGLANVTHGPLLLLGDDTEMDPEVLAGIAAEFPGRVPRVYIHAVTGKGLWTCGVTRFYTAFDVAVAEANAGRLSVPEAVKVGEAVSQSIDRAFPSFVCCPSKRPMYDCSSGVTSDPRLCPVARKVSDAINRQCGPDHPRCEEHDML